jgi:PEP-CTERM motif
LDGQSYQRKNAYVDTNTAADWEAVGDSSIPAAQRSTPGTVPVPEPASIFLMLGFAGVSGICRRTRSGR